MSEHNKLRIEQGGTAIMTKKPSFNTPILALLSVMAITGCQSTTGGASSAKIEAGWLQHDVAMRQADQMRVRNRLPVSIQCKVDGGTSSDPSRAVRVKWVSTEKAIRWTWAVGDDRDIAKANTIAAANGLKIASKYRAIDARTKLSSVCAIWHGKPGN
ncbi:hypothetical protein GGQ99_000344 [Aminobacter niigataensis]|uniref:Ig-like domain-containing protein n=1 Tax=Aminobacter niigataensis TaxID=83265 RepID=A0ABR6KVT0_9HYPH|nr:hypothetical protein [Aminobacter niigataensis]MBB4648622.1 hypothetical protein [Aminobacter niigataensis]